MSLSLRYLGVGVLFAASLVAGCSSTSDGLLEGPVYAGTAVDASISFTHSGTLKLAPGETIDVTVSTTPPERYEISFYLVGDALDASFERATVVAGANGKASARLRAPNASTNFGLRAVIKDGPSAELSVAVSDQGFGALEIQPDYNGDRNVREWLARVVSGTTCEALAESFPADPEGALSAVAPPNADLVVQDAPVGPNLVVFVRAGHYMWGCADEPNLVANETTEISVKIINKPIDTSETKLDVQLSFEPAVDDWQAILDDQAALLQSAFFGQSQSTAELLLGAMSSLSNDPQQFDS